MSSCRPWRCSGGASLLRRVSPNVQTRGLQEGKSFRLRLNVDVAANHTAVNEAQCGQGHDSLAVNVRRSDRSSCSVELGHPGSGRPSALGPAAEPARSKRPGGRGGPVNRADGLLSIGRGPVDSLEFALMRQRTGRSSRSGGRTPVDPGEVQSIGGTDSCRSGEVQSIGPSSCRWDRGPGGPVNWGDGLLSIRGGPVDRVRTRERLCPQRVACRAIPALCRWPGADRCPSHGSSKEWRQRGHSGICQERGWAHGPQVGVSDVRSVRTGSPLRIALEVE